MTFNPKAYEPGDTIKITQTFQVVRREHKTLVAEDVKSGEEFIFWPANDSMRVEMVKRAPRPKPKAGDIITGKQVCDQMWKRGTTIRCVRVTGIETKNLAALVLFADGKWHDVEGMSSYDFRDLNPTAGFEILLVA